MTKRKVARRRRRRGYRRRKNRKQQRGGKKFAITLNRLKKLSPTNRRKAMEIANSRFIRHLSSQVKKMRTAKLSPKLKGRMRRYAKELRKVANPKTSIKNKRKVLTQRGGFIPLLLAALPALGSIIGGVISRA